MGKRFRRIAALSITGVVVAGGFDGRGIVLDDAPPQGQAQGIEHGRQKHPQRDRAGPQPEDRQRFVRKLHG